MNMYTANPGHQWHPTAHKRDAYQWTRLRRFDHTSSRPCKLDVGSGIERLERPLVGPSLRKSIWMLLKSKKTLSSECFLLRTVCKLADNRLIEKLIDQFPSCSSYCLVRAWRTVCINNCRSGGWAPPSCPVELAARVLRLRRLVNFSTKASAHARTLAHPPGEEKKRRACNHL